MEQSRKVDRHPVGICTVAESSADSSIEVPMKSKERQAQASFSSQLIRLCYRGGMVQSINSRETTINQCVGWLNLAVPRRNYDTSIRLTPQSDMAI